MDNTNFTTSDLPYNHPVCPGPGFDEGSYLCQHPMVEPYEGPAVLADNGQDLERTIGKHTVRLHTIRDTHPSIEGVAVHVAGTFHKSLSHSMRLTALDIVTAGVGGRAVCGKGAFSWGTTRRPEIHLSVKFPAALSALLTIDGKEREIWVTIRDSLNSTHKFHPFVWMRNPSTGCTIAIRSTSFSKSYRHTKSHLGFAPRDLQQFARDLPGRIAAHAQALRTMAGKVLGYDDLVQQALVIANDGDDVVGDIKEDSLWKVAQALVDMVTKADGKRVPKSPIPGVYTAFQLFEAACAFDRFDRIVRDDKDPQGDLESHKALVRVNRMLDNETYGDVALDLLAGFQPKMVQSMPADWAARFVSVENLPALDPMPEGISLPEFVDLAQVRALYCTTLAPSDADADDRIDTLCRITDPMRVLAIVAPNLPVKDTRPVESEGVVQLQSELSRLLEGDGPFDMAA